MSGIDSETGTVQNADSVDAAAVPEGSVRAGSDKRTGACELYGIVLAGVHAWGGCVLDEVTYRPLLPVAGRPLICHALGWLRGQGVRSASLCANSDTRGLRRYLGDGRGLDMALEYYEDVMPRGPAGCVRDAGVERRARYLVVVYGTIVPEVSLEEVLRAHVQAQAVLTVVATRATMGPARGSWFLQPAGVYIFSAEALEHVPESGYQDIKETLIPRLHAAGERVGTYVVGEDSVGQVRDTRSYMLVNQWATERACREGVEQAGYVRTGEGWVHESARLGSRVSLIGPVIIEAGAVIEDGAVIVGPSTVGRGCRIGCRALISRSVIWSRCQVGAGAVVDHCVVADDGKINEGEVIRDTVWVPGSRHGLRRSRMSRLAGQFIRRENLAPLEGPVVDGGVLAERWQAGQRQGAAATGRARGGTRSSETAATSEGAARW